MTPTPRTAAGRALHEEWHAEMEPLQTGQPVRPCGSLGCGFLSRIIAIEAASPDARSEGLRALLDHFGHDYNIDGRMEWHSLNCLYRKFWATEGMPDEDACVVARAALAAPAAVDAPEQFFDIHLAAIASCIRQDCQHFDSAECIRALAAYEAKP